MQRVFVSKMRCGCTVAVFTAFMIAIDPEHSKLLTTKVYFRNETFDNVRVSTAALAFSERSVRLTNIIFLLKN